jgi:hypothetical protein
MDNIFRDVLMAKREPWRLALCLGRTLADEKVRSEMSSRMSIIMAGGLKFQGHKRQWKLPHYYFMAFKATRKGEFWRENGFRAKTGPILDLPAQRAKSSFQNPVYFEVSLKAHANK